MSGNMAPFDVDDIWRSTSCRTQVLDIETIHPFTERRESEDFALYGTRDVDD